MVAGIRATIAIDARGMCPVADASSEIEPPIQDTARATIPDSEGVVTEEFSIPASAELEETDATQIFKTETSHVYRFDRQAGAGCVCECIEANRTPVVGLSARNGHLHVTFHPPDLETLRRVVDDLHGTFGEVRVQQLSHQTDGDSQDLVLFDRGVLTARQREVFETSYELGYFEHPRRANAGDVADALGINRSTFREHLTAAQRKLLKSVLDGVPQ